MGGGGLLHKSSSCCHSPQTVNYSGGFNKSSCDIHLGYLFIFMCRVRGASDAEAHEYGLLGLTKTVGHEVAKHK